MTPRFDKNGLMYPMEIADRFIDYIIANDIKEFHYSVIRKSLCLSDREYPEYRIRNMLEILRRRGDIRYHYKKRCWVVIKNFKKRRKAR